MNKIIPESFTTFLKAILVAQSRTDQWRAKVFYKPPEQITKLLMNKFEMYEKVEQKITLDSVTRFFQQKQHKKTLSEQDHKVLMKYFSFQISCRQTKEQFINRLKPIDNKLITGIQKIQSTQECIINLLLSILDGFQYIKKARLQCNQDLQKIVKFFDKQFRSKSLTKDSLKQYLFEGDFYNRVNFNYLKDYIFGQNQQKIQWSAIFKKIIIVADQINEVQQQNFTSQQQINTTKKLKEMFKDKQNIQKNIQLYQFQPSLILQTVSDIQSMTEARSGKIIPPNGELISQNTLSQINRIELMLNQTKQKYLRNKEQLQNSKKQLKQKNFIKKEQSSQKTMKKLIQQIGSFKIVKQQSYGKKQENNQYKKGTIINMIYEESPQKNDQNQNKITQYLDQSQVKIFQSNKSLGLLKNQKIENHQNNIIRTNSIIIGKTDRRQIGKIKKRSVSKEKDTQKPYIIDKERSRSKNKQQNSRILNLYQKIYQKPVQSRQKLTLALSGKNYQSNSQIKLYRPLMRNSFNQYQQNKKYAQISTIHSFQHSKRDSQNRISQIMKQIDTNAYHRSRVSSKKKQEIVQMATNQARLRIQQIQKKALNRMAKIDSQIEENFKASQIKRKFNSSLNHIPNTSITKNKLLISEYMKQNSKSKLNTYQNINYQKPYSTTLKLASTNSVRNRYA